MRTLTKKRARAMLGNKLEGFSKGGKAQTRPEAHSELGAFSTHVARPPAQAYYLPDNWRAALAGARAHACQDETRPFLCQIVLTGEYAVATDAHRLVRMSCPLHQGGVPTGELPPERWVRLPARIGWEHFPSNGNAHVKIWHDYPEGRAQLASGGLRLSAQTEAGDLKCEDPLRGFPRVWDAPIPGGEPTAEITFCPREWISALRDTLAPGLFIEEVDADAESPYAHIREWWDTNQRNGNGGQWAEPSPWAQKGRGAALALETAEIGWSPQCFNPSYLLDALEAIAPDHDSAVVTMQCYAKTTGRDFQKVAIEPIVLRRGDSLALVMPRRM